MAEITEKRCTKCGEVKGAMAFHKSKHAKSGLMSQCKLCRNGFYRKYHRCNSEKMRTRANEYCKNNPEKVREYRRKSRQNNDKKIKAADREYYKRNAKKINSRCLKYHHMNCKELSDVYIRHRLKGQNIPMTPENIEVKRQIIQLYRINKQLKEVLKNDSRSVSSGNNA